MAEAELYYFVAEGVVGEESVYRVVRAATETHGLRSFAFISLCQTRRAALALAKALNERRATVPAPPAERRWSSPPVGATPYRLRPSC